MPANNESDGVEDFEDDDELSGEDDAEVLTTAQLDARRIRDPDVRALLLPVPEPPSLASKEDLREVSHPSIYSRQDLAHYL